MKYLYLLILLFPIACFAQFKIEGKIVSDTKGTHVPNASIFINNTTIGTKADTNGFFSLHNLKQGQYELIVSSVGYETYRRTIVVNQNMVLPDIRMQQYILMANEVSIVGKDPKRDKKLKMFKEQFLGRAIFWRDCKIINPQVLKLTFSKHETMLTASTRDFLEIENDALGYKLKYLLSDFVLDKEALKMQYEGFAFFEEKNGTPAQKEKWEQNRHRVYYGSPTHFLRTVLTNTTDSDFVVRPSCIKFIGEVTKLRKTRSSNGESIDTISYLIPRYDTLYIANYIHKTKRGVYAKKAHLHKQAGFKSRLIIYPEEELFLFFFFGFGFVLFVNNFYFVGFFVKVNH
jgi:hypothetical protein